MAGATAGAASTLAGSETSEACPKCAAMSGAVPSVAAPVSAVASARPRGSPRRTRPSRTRPASSEDGHDRREAQLPADVLDRARVERQRDGRRQQQRVPARGRAGPASTATTAAAPITPARWIDGPPPASGT